MERRVLAARVASMVAAAGRLARIALAAPALDLVARRAGLFSRGATTAVLRCRWAEAAPGISGPALQPARTSPFAPQRREGRPTGPVKFCRSSAGREAAVAPAERHSPARAAAGE